MTCVRFMTWPDIHAKAIADLQQSAGHRCAYCVTAVQEPRQGVLVRFTRQGDATVHPVCRSCARRHRADIQLRAAEYEYWRTSGQNCPQSIM
jgi:hypothetical protein